MPDESHLNNLIISFKRIFALPITKATYRQVQNAVFTNIESMEERKEIFEALLTASFKDKMGEKNKRVSLKALLEEFSIPVRVAKEVEDKGELLLFITSDLIQQHTLSVLYNRARRVDGAEFAFYTDDETTVHLLEHFMKRVVEFQQKNKEFSNKFKKNLIGIKAICDELLK